MIIIKIVDADLDWINKIIETRALELENKKRPDGWFSLASISKVPYIEFPYLSSEKCAEIQEQAMQVLRTSIRQNSYKEVAITYDLNEESIDKYIVTNGEFGYICLMNDEKVKNLLFSTKEKRDLAVVSLHNHPNDSFFSINDLITFAENPSIRIMEIINTKGEVAFLLRPQFEIYRCVVETILNAEPDYVEKKDIFQKKNNGHVPKISDIITDIQIRNEIIYLSVSMLEDKGVFVSSYINMENVQCLDFSKFTSDYKESKQTFVDNSNLYRTINNLKYLENGED